MEKFGGENAGCLLIMMIWGLISSDVGACIILEGIYYPPAAGERCFPRKCVHVFELSN